MSLTPTVKPLMASVTISKVSTYTPTDELLECNLTLSADNQSSIFDMRLDNRSGAYTSVMPGAVVTVQVGKTSGSFATLFTGVVERKRIDRPSRFENYLDLSGTDYSFYLLNTIVPGARGDTGSYVIEAGNVNRQSGWYVDLIVKDLISKHTPIITTSNVNTTSTYLPEITFNYKPLGDCIKELADLAPLFNYYVDGSKDLHFFFEESQDSGLIVDNALIKTLSMETDIQNTKNIFYVLGGDQSATDVNYAGVSASINMYSAYQAVMFTPTQPVLKDVWVYVGKTGTLTDDLQGEVRLGSGLGATSESPTGAVLSVFSISKDKIPSTPDWRIATINYEPLTVNLPHWVVLYKDGGNSTNTYNWSNDGGSTGTNASANDGLTWTVRTSSYLPAMRTINTSKIIHKDVDEDSVNNYGALEMAISKPEMNERDQVIVMAQKYKRQYAKARTEINMSIYPPDTQPLPGQLITVSDTISGVSGQFIATQLEYTIAGVECHNVAVKAFRFE